MSPGGGWIVLAVAALLVAAAAAAAAVLQGRRLARELEAVRSRTERETREALQAVTARLDDIVGRFHSQLGVFGREMNESLTRQMTASQKTLGEGITNVAKVFGSVREQLGQVTEIAARMEQLGRGIGELESILKVPKLRGIFGEKALEELLRQALPAAAWEVQHRFSDGRTVDAVVRVGDRMVPLDAKFPLEAYRRLAEAGDDAARKAAEREFKAAVKGRVDEIAERYIRPGEGTYEFALMFVPAEGVYGELVASDGGALFDYAIGRRVLPVSPSTLFAYLSTVATGLRGLEVEQNAQEILRGIGAVEEQLQRFGEDFDVLGRHLNNAVTKYADAVRRLESVRTRLEGLAGRCGPEAGM